MKTPVLMRHEFALPGSQSSDGFVNYMNREAARKPRAQSADAYTEYMGNPAKGANLYDVNGRPIDDVPGLLDQINDRAARGIGFSKLVLSYDDAWAEEHCPPGTEAERIRVEGRYVKRLAEKAGMEDPIVLAAPHLNTDNQHSHWLIMDSKQAPLVTDRVYRLPADYVRQHRLLRTASGDQLKPGRYTGSDKKNNGKAAHVFAGLKARLRAENHGAPAMIRSNFDVNPDGSIDFRISDHAKNHTEPPSAAQLIDVETRQEMKFSEKDMRVCREAIARDIGGQRDPALNMRKWSRGAAESARELANYSDPMIDRLDALIDKLQATGVPPSKWQMGNNQLAALRPEIADLAREVVREQDTEGYDKFNRQLSTMTDDYQASTNKDLNTRWGNSVLKVAQMRAADPGRVPTPKKRKKTRPVSSSRPRRRAITPQVEHALQAKAMKDSLTHAVMAAIDWNEKKENMRAYYRMVNHLDEPIFKDAFESVFGRSIGGRG